MLAQSLRHPTSTDLPPRLVAYVAARGAAGRGLPVVNNTRQHTRHFSPCSGTRVQPVEHIGGYRRYRSVM
jgi:hypothetical protein